MKELSIEEKAKAYDNALKVLHKYDGANIMFSQSLKEEMFSELKESEDEKMRKDLIIYLRSILSNKKYGDKFIEDWIAWLEAKGEQNPTDKVEPKFKDGDWVVWDNKISCHIDNIYQGKESLMYTITDAHNMTRNYSVKGFDNNSHLWTIEDAKDGDVLINWSNTAFIFKAIEDETVKFHIAYNEKWDEIKTPSTKLSHLGLPEPQFEFHPATKEQRDQLEKAMADAGYTFDFEKKELKKIEQKPIEDVDLPEFESYLCLMFQKFRTKGVCTNGEIIDFVKEYSQKLKDTLCHAWNEEDEEEASYIADFIENLLKKEKLVSKKTMIMEEMVAWLRDIKYRYLPKPEQGWGEEDEIARKALINLVEIYYGGCIDKTEKNRLLNLLKSLKERYTWRPSEEQMDALHDAAVYVDKSMFPYPKGILMKLYKQLKKLRDE